MKAKKDPLSQNTDNSFGVDSKCINCGSCWRVDPDHFAPTGNSAYVYNQPNGGKEINKALLALVDCPVAAISAPKGISLSLYNDLFPIPVTSHPAGEVYYCGWSSKLSFGASSWLIRRKEGNVLIDSPRWSSLLAKRIKQLGGVSQMVLTHRDDVADHNQWSKELKCERWIHKEDLDAAPETENHILGTNTYQLGKDIKLIPTPGHTKGSIVALLGNQKQILFSGDHLWWNLQKEVLVASKDFCWWSWNEQLESVKRLLDLDVQWLLPGHGYAKQFKPGEWRESIQQTLCHSKGITTSTKL